MQARLPAVALAAQLVALPQELERLPQSVLSVQMVAPVWLLLHRALRVLPVPTVQGVRVARHVQVDSPLLLPRPAAPPVRLGRMPVAAATLPALHVLLAATALPLGPPLQPRARPVLLGGGVAALALMLCRTALSALLGGTGGAVVRRHLAAALRVPLGIHLWWGPPAAQLAQRRSTLQTT